MTVGHDDGLNLLKSNGLIRHIHEFLSIRNDSIFGNFIIVIKPIIGHDKGAWQNVNMNPYSGNTYNWRQNSNGYHEAEQQLRHIYR